MTGEYKTLYGLMNLINKSDCNENSSIKVVWKQQKKAVHKNKEPDSCRYTPLVFSIIFHPFLLYFSL